MRSLEEITEWLTNKLAENLKVQPDTIDLDNTFDQFGVNSIELMALTIDIDLLIGLEVEPNSMYEYNSINKLAGHLMQLQLANQK